MASVCFDKYCNVIGCRQGKIFQYCPFYLFARCNVEPINTYRKTKTFKDDQNNQNEESEWKIGKRRFLNIFLCTIPKYCFAECVWKKRIENALYVNIKQAKVKCNFWDFCRRLWRWCSSIRAVCKRVPWFSIVQEILPFIFFIALDYTFFLPCIQAIICTRFSIINVYKPCSIEPKNYRTNQIISVSMSCNTSNILWNYSLTS